ncbi:MAG TPA: T9SS type A sorting domain-containing protein, partial [Bacteroidales bacterium]|nr:T9SS type A sorting domain-containing protein [Bacteroidales bacterium]
MKFIITLTAGLLVFFSGHDIAPCSAQPSASVQAQQKTLAIETINISGTGHNLPFYNHPPDAGVNVWYEGGIVGNTALSEVDGSYSLTVSLTGIHRPQIHDFVVKPSPFAERVQIDFYSSGGIHHIRVMDMKGAVILQKEFNLSNGNHTLQLSGLGQGVKLVNITTAAGASNTFKLIQTGNNLNPAMDISQAGTKTFKTGMANELLFEFYAPGHETYTVTATAQPTMNVDYVLPQESETGSRTKTTQTNDSLFNAGIPEAN